MENGDDNNFNYINNEENDLKYSEDKIKDKFRKMDELLQSFDDIYNTNGILVPI